jgi:transcriptional regulator with XRE-family HTH domain
MAQIRDKKLLQKMAVVLKELREATGLIQDDVYDHTGIHIGRIETANVNLSVSTLSELCKFYKITLVDFFKRVERV